MGELDLKTIEERLNECARMRRAVNDMEAALRRLAVELSVHTQWLRMKEQEAAFWATADEEEDEY